MYHLSNIPFLILQTYIWESGLKITLFYISVTHPTTQLSIAIDLPSFCLMKNPIVSTFKVYNRHKYQVPTLNLRLCFMDDRIMLLIQLLFPIQNVVNHQRALHYMAFCWFKLCIVREIEDRRRRSHHHQRREVHLT